MIIYVGNIGSGLFLYVAGLLLFTFSIFLTYFKYFKMRQLKGKVKETNKQKKERKKEFVENKRKVFTIALPTLGAAFFLIGVYIYVKTRPKMMEEY